MNRAKAPSSDAQQRPPGPDTAGKVRLHKFMAATGVASRRACEQLIIQGRVAVNGEVVRELPAWVEPGRDHVTVDGRPLRGKPGRRTYLILNKPRGVICTSSDPQGRRRVVDLVPPGPRLFCVGRLDAESMGLLLLTDDGELAFALTHPRFGVSKTYEVAVQGRLEEPELRRMLQGVWLADRDGAAAPARATAVRVLARDRQRTRLLITLHEGRNRAIRRMVAYLGHRVRRLRRLTLGPLKLTGLPPGGWRELTGAEVAALRRCTEKKGGNKMARLGRLGMEGAGRYSSPSPKSRGHRHAH